MKLRSQMLLAAALTLAVPLVGWKSVKQLYGALQQTRIDEQTLKVANMRLALSEASDIQTAMSNARSTTVDSDWHVESSRYPIFIDGYDDDWQNLLNAPRRYQDQTLSVIADVRTARHGKRLYLFIAVRDQTVIYHTPPVLRADAGEGEQPDRQSLLVNGDSVELLVQGMQTSDGAPEWQHALIRTIAPGPVEVVRATDSRTVTGERRSAGLRIDGWEAAWVKSRDGYQLEIALPLPANGSKAAFAVVDVDYRGERRARWAGSLSPLAMARAYRTRQSPVELATGSLFYLSDAAAARLEPWVLPGGRARLFDIHGRLLADVNNLYAQIPDEDEALAAAGSSKGLWDAILLRVFAFFVAGDLPLLPESQGSPLSLSLSRERRATVLDDQPVTTRYVTDENDRVLGTLAPVGSEPRRGYLLFESNEEHASAYAGSELARLFSLLLLVSLLAGSGLLVFAFVLSSRIRRLSREAQHAVSADGRVHGLPGSDARDEIGDLSRKLSTLLARSAAYTQYLEALSSRLSHELRTPLSVVRTSIENLDRDSLDAQSTLLIDRASSGAEHLGAIIQALVESTRLEQTVQMADRQPVNLSHWLAGLQARYRQVYDGVEFRLSMEAPAELSITASPELLCQAFDILVDNAVSFARSGPVVLHLGLEQDRTDRGNDVPRLQLAVINRGDPLDETTLMRLFDPMYSARTGTGEAASGELHLGLGLYIVRMIAEAHEGTVMASHEDGWNMIGMRLPGL
ncbi:MAG: hypothetical protein HKN42_02230 [Granulosicoccus sp.]|nr:hypothetical protein [Granulosicoccus sp.]